MTGQEQIDAHRAEIDEIDDVLLELIGRRAAHAQALAAAKAAGGPSLALRPAREAQVLRRLLARLPAGVDVDLVIEVWRSLMTANLRRQQAIEVLVAGAGDTTRLFDLARRHFGASTKITRLDDPRTAMTRVAETLGAVAVAPWPGSTGPGGWWPMLNERRYHKLAIIAALPLRADGADPEAALIGADAALEPAGEDFTLAVAFDPYHRVVRALNESGLAGREIGRARETVLLRFDGFVSPVDPRIPILVSSGLDGFRVVGSFSRI